MSKGTPDDSDAETEDTRSAASSRPESPTGKSPSPPRRGAGSKYGPIEMEEPDAYGQVHPVETPELIESRLGHLEEELEVLPEGEKVGWEKALERCPDLVGDDHKLMFLRCEVFQPDLAASRLVQYWDKRIELFGEERAFLPLTLDGALRGDIDALLFGFVRANDRMVDASGRRILFLDPSLLDDHDGAAPSDRESMNRATWYVVHSALEDETTQRRGVVMVVHPQNARLNQFDRTLLDVHATCVRGCIPVRVGAFHVCHPPLFAHMILPLVKLFLGQRLGSRVHVHKGKKDAVLGRLGKFGISKKCAPSNIGGYLVLDQDLWLADRRVARG